MPMTSTESESGQPVTACTTTPVARKRIPSPRILVIRKITEAVFWIPWPNLMPITS